MKDYLMNLLKLAALGFIPVLAASEGDPFHLSGKKNLLLGGNIVYRGLTQDLVADRLDSNTFQDLYVVKMPLFIDIKPVILTYGTIVKEVENDFAVVRMSESRAEKLTGAIHRSFGNCGGVLKLNGELDFSGEILAPSKPITPIDQMISGIEKVHGMVKTSNIRASVESLAAMNTRYHKSDSGIKVPAFLKQKYEAIARDRKDIQIDFFKNQNSPQDNIRVRIVGATRPDEIVVIGSHIDSINSSGSGNGRAPGADDNASGTATNLEIFRVLMESGWKFDRTIEIHGYAAEEAGLVGSANMAKYYRDNNINVVSMVQFDMNLFQSTKELIMWFVENDTDPTFNKELQALVTQYQKVRVNQKKLFGGTSDHRSWNSKGFKASFPFEDASSYNSKIHSANDTIENSGNFPLATEFTKLGLSYFAHYAGKI